MEDVVEKESLKDLEKIVSETRKWGLKLVLIGGYAVRAYTRGYRYTKDMDFIMLKKDIGKLTALLKEFGYSVRETQFGLAGRKSIDGNSIDLHVNAGEVFDLSTDKTYPVAEETLGEATELEISGFYPSGREIKVVAPVVSLEDLLLMKLMPRNREKDGLDVISLLLDCGDDLDVGRFSQKCAQANLSDHIRKSALAIVGKIRTGTLPRAWMNASGRRLLRKEENRIIELLKAMGK